MSRLILVGVLATFVPQGPIQCGPTDEEMGRSVLTASPVVCLVLLSLLLLLTGLWRRQVGGLVIRWRPIKRLFVLLATGAVLSLLAQLWSPWRVSWVVSALVCYGTSHCTLALVTWRIWFAVNRVHALTGALLSSTAVMLIPAVLLAMGLGSWIRFDWVLYLWVYPGYHGITTAVVLAVLLLDVWERSRCRSSSSE